MYVVTKCTFLGPVEAIYTWNLVIFMGGGRNGTTCSSQNCTNKVSPLMCACPLAHGLP